MKVFSIFVIQNKENDADKLIKYKRKLFFTNVGLSNISNKHLILGLFGLESNNCLRDITEGSSVVNVVDLTRIV